MEATLPAIGNLVVADATPANKTLYPLSASIGSSRFSARDAATVAGNRSLEYKMSLASSARVTDRITLLYARPYEVTEAGIVIVQSIARAAIEFVVPASLPVTERGHFWAEVKNLVALAATQSYVKDRDPMY